ncbi:MAG: hypothetical protein ABR506_00565 [Candidatus Krumholzibacteriia bacterium]
MKTRFLPLWLFLVLLAPTLVACSAGTSAYVRDDVDASFVRRVAVLPFGNLSQDVHAATRLHSVFTTRLLQREVFAVASLGEVLGAMGRLRLTLDAVPSPEQFVALGQELGIDAFFLGTVDNYGLERSGNQRTYLVTATFTLVETQTGSVIWTAQVHRDGGSLGRKLFGGGSASQHAVSRDAVDSALGTLF